MTTAFPARFEAVRATSGAAMRHGAHHSAQKSAITGTGDFSTISSNVSASTSRGYATGGSAALHAPHCPESDKWSGGIRFLRPHALHDRMTGMDHRRSPRYNTNPHRVQPVGRAYGRELAGATRQPSQ